MKKIICLIIGLILITVGVSDVSALEEYNVVINGSPVVTNAKDNSVVSDYSNILTYENKVLTIKENVYIKNLDVYDELTITSNGKQVYINQIRNSHNTNPITINKFNCKPFGVLAFNVILNGNISITDSVINVLVTYYMRVDGDVNITDSVIKSLSETKTDSFELVLDGNMNIINSTIDVKSRNFWLTCNGEKMSIINSTINIGHFTQAFSNHIWANYNMYIEKSNIEGIDYGGLAVGDDFTIIDSRVKTKSINAGNLKIENGEIDLKSCIVADSVNIVNSIASIGDHMEAQEDLNIKNSIIAIAGGIESYNDNITIDDSKITMYDSMGTTRIYCKSVLNINKSTISIKKNKDKPEIGRGYIYGVKGLKLVDSTYTNELESYRSKTENMIIKNSLFKTTGNYTTKKIEIDNSVVDLNSEDVGDSFILVEAANASTINNSIVTLKSGFRTKGDLSLKDSYLYTKNTGTGKWSSVGAGETFSPLIVGGNLDINNSSLIAESINKLPAVLVKGNISIREGEFKNNEKNVLKVEKKRVTADNFLYNPDSVSKFGNAQFVQSNDEVVTTVLNGNISTYADTEGYYKITFKVANGSWSDSTTEDKITDIVIKEKLVEEDYPTDMVANEGFSSGSWLKTGDKEYTYTFVKSESNKNDKEEKLENPETGIVDYTIISSIFIIILGCFYFYIKNKGYFKKI